jgi:hypothetical protein
MSIATPIPRRTFLRGLGTMVALPALNSLLPAGAKAAGTATAAGPQRLAWVYVPNGANMVDWTPAATGPAYELPPILQPLAAHQDKFSVVTGLANPMGDELGDGGGAHARASASFLTGVHPRKTAGADIKTGISCDQIAANQIGDQTRLRSLELSCDGGQRAGSCDSGYSCIYQFNLSWKSETQPMLPEVNPRAAFERLFGNPDQVGATLETAARRKLYQKSLLDYVLDDAHRLEKRLDATDRRKLDEYLSSVRDLERRIARAEQFPVPARPVGVEAPEMFETYEQHMQLMYEVMALAFQTDSTRIATFIVAHDGSNRPYPTIGIRDGHHDLSHHRNDEAKKKLLARINRYHVEQFGKFLDRLKSIPEGNGTLLDNCLIQYGSALSNGNEHDPHDLPILLAGGGGGRLATGRHLKVDDRTPMTNLYRSMLDSAGVHTEKIGDSTGKLDTIFSG